MSKILLSYAGDKGSTGRIALLIAGELERAGHVVRVAPADQAPDARHFDAVIVGSHRQGHHWERAALRYVRAQAPDLAERPAYLFEDVSGQAPRQHGRRPMEREAFGIGIALPQQFDLADATGAVIEWARAVAADLATPVATDSREAILGPGGRA